MSIFWVFLCIQAFVSGWLIFEVDDEKELLKGKALYQIMWYLFPFLLGEAAGGFVYQYSPFLFGFGEGERASLGRWLVGLSAGGAVTLLGAYLFRRAWFYWKLFKEVAGWE